MLITLTRKLLFIYLDGRYKRLEKPIHTQHTRCSPHMRQQQADSFAFFYLEFDREVCLMTCNNSASLVATAKKFRHSAEEQKKIFVGWFVFRTKTQNKKSNKSFEWSAAATAFTQFGVGNRMRKRSVSKYATIFLDTIGSASIGSAQHSTECVVFFFLYLVRAINRRIIYSS